MRILEKVRNSNAIKNISYTFMGKIVAMILYMLLDIVCVRILPIDVYAEWVFFFSVLTMLFYIGWFGINNSTKVFVSKQDNRTDVGLCIKGAIFLRGIVSIVICVAIVLIAPFLAKQLGYPGKYPHLLYLLLISSGIVFFNSFSEFFKGIFMGMEKFKHLFLITVLEYSGYFLFSLFLLLRMRKVEAIATGYVASGVVVFFSGIYFLKTSKDINFHVSEKQGIRKYSKAVFRYAIPIAVIGIGGVILVEMDTFMLGMLSSKEQMATYGIAKNLCSKATHVNQALTVGSMTSFSILSYDNIEAKRNKFIKTSNLNIVISLVVSGAFLAFGPLAIRILYGQNYELAGETLRFLVPYYMLYGISNFFSIFLDFQGKAKFRSICYLSMMVLNILLNFILIPRYGAIGAAVATSVSLVPYTIMVIIETIRIYVTIEKRIRCGDIK